MEIKTLEYYKDIVAQRYERGNWEEVRKEVAANETDRIDFEFMLSEAAEMYASEKLDLKVFESLTQLQLDYGYKEGDINPVALLGLFGEAGEVLAEVILITDKNPMNTLQGAAVNIAELVDDMKKRIRKDPDNAPGTFIMAEDGGVRLDTEMADVLYYLNLLALNRGKDLAYYAQLSVDKVKVKSKMM